MTYLLGLREFLTGEMLGREDDAVKVELPKAQQNLAEKQASLLIVTDQMRLRQTQVNTVIQASNKIAAKTTPAEMKAEADAIVVEAEAEAQVATNALLAAQTWSWNLWRDPVADLATTRAASTATAKLTGAEEVRTQVTAAVNRGQTTTAIRATTLPAVQTSTARLVTTATVEVKQVTVEVAEAQTKVADVKLTVNPPPVADPTPAPAPDPTPAPAPAPAPEPDPEPAPEPPAPPAPLANPVTYNDTPYGPTIFNTTVSGIPLKCGQNANVHLPAGVPKGCVLWFPGGGWCIANKDDIGNPEAAQAMQAAGYVFINANYRQATDGSGPGLYVGQGGYYDNGSNDGIADCVRLLRYLLDPSEAAGVEAASYSAVWDYVRPLVAEYGLLVAGVSAGGYMTMHSVFRYGAATGRWPRGALNFAGPADVTYTWGPVTDVQRNLVRNYFKSYLPDETPAFDAIQRQASMQHSFGAYSSAFLASDMQLHFVRNTHDTIVVTAMLKPFIDYVKAIAPTRVTEHVVSEMWPPGAATPWPSNHNVIQPLDVYILKAALRVFA